MQKFSHFLLQLSKMVIKIRGMSTRTTENEIQRKDLAHLMTKPFTEAEKETVKAARKKAGIDRPVFYHDAIIEYANRINGEKNA